MKRTAFLLLIIFSAGVSVFAISAKDILVNIDREMNAPKDQEMVSRIILKDKKGDTKERIIEIFQKGSDKRLARFTAPSDQKGISFLSLPGGETYLYLPAFKKVRRIASHVKNTSFAGTDFSYSDMEAKAYADDHGANILSEDSSTYTIESFPNNPNDYEYSKIIMKVAKDSFVPLEIEFINKKGTAYKKLVSRKIEKSGKYWVAGEREMTDLITGHSTTIINTSVKFDTGLKDDFFTTRTLER